MAINYSLLLPVKLKICLVGAPGKRQFSRRLSLKFVLLFSQHILWFKQRRMKKSFNRRFDFDLKDVEIDQQIE